MQIRLYFICVSLYFSHSRMTSNPVTNNRWRINTFIIFDFRFRIVSFDVGLQTFPQANCHKKKPNNNNNNTKTTTGDENIRIRRCRINTGGARKRAVSGETINKINDPAPGTQWAGLKRACG